MSRTIVKVAAMLMIMTLLSRVIGFVRELFLAHQFGVGELADAFKLAFNIPNTLFLFIPGALNAVFLPVLKKLLSNSETKLAQKLYHQMFTFLTIIYLLIAVIGMILSKQIVGILAPSYSGEQLLIATQMMQIMWPSAVFISFIGLFQATLNAHEQFYIPALSGVVNSLIVIAAYPLLVPRYGIHGVAIGTTFGFLGASMTMLPSLLKAKYSFKLDLNWNTPDMRKIGERFIPIMLGSLITQMTVFIETFFATGLDEGKLSSLRYAFTVYQLPMAIFVGAFTLPILPYLVEYFNKGQFNRMRNSLTEAMQYLFILMVPTITLMIIIPEEIIAFVFQWGAGSAFDQEGVRLTSIALTYYSIGLFFLAGRDLLTRAFYAIGNTIVPVVISVVSIGLYVVATYLLIPYMDHGGIALGTSITALCNMMLLAFILHRRIKGFMFPKFWSTAAKTIAASVLMGAVVFVASNWSMGRANVGAGIGANAEAGFDAGAGVGASQWLEKGYIIVLLLVAVITYTLLMLLFKEQKVIDLLKTARKKLLRT